MAVNNAIRRTETMFGTTDERGRRLRKADVITARSKV
jgi:hypothetical protein